jgi:hypothetical protein
MAATTHARTTRAATQRSGATMYPLRHIHNRRSTASGDYSVEQPGDLRETPRMVSRAPSV